MARRPPGTTAVQSLIPREDWHRFKGFSLMANAYGSSTMTPNSRLATLVAWAVENGVIAVSDATGNLKLVRLRSESVEDVELQEVGASPDSPTENTNDIHDDGDPLLTATKPAPGTGATSAPSDGDSTPRPRPSAGPSQIGGRRSDEDDTKGRPPRSDAPETPHPQMRRPELQCHEVQHSLWQVVVALPDTPDQFEVLHEGNQLTPSGSLCRINDLGGRIIVKRSNGDETVLDLKLPLVFKTPGSWKGIGRRVRRITRGYFLVIAPNDWKREGHPQIDPAEVTAPGYRAHYEHSDGRDSKLIGFAGHDPLPTAADTHLLKGPTVFDDSDKGLLFGGYSPELTNPDAFEYAVVGEEGKPNGWRCEFKPLDHKMRDVLDGREGWLFLRLYDADVALVASTDFRYSANLAQIRLNDVPYSDATILLPMPTGHAPAHLTFVDASGETIPHRFLSPVGAGGMIPPEHAADKVRAELKSSLGRVPIEISLPRLWWQALDDKSQGNWRATPFRWTIEEFSRFADIGTRLCLSVPRHVRGVRCGFDEDTGRFTRAGSYIDIPLKEFLDAEALDADYRGRPSLNISCGSLFKGIPIVHLVNENPETRKDLDFDRPLLIPLPHFNPRVDSDDLLVRHQEGEGLPNWSEARRDGVLTLGQGSRPLNRPLPAKGSRIWAYLDGKGYVGVGRVVAGISLHDPHGAGGYQLSVRWLDTVPERDAYVLDGLICPHGIVPGYGGGDRFPWTILFSETIEALKSHFKKWDADA